MTSELIFKLVVTEGGKEIFSTALGYEAIENIVAYYPDKKESNDFFKLAARHPASSVRENVAYKDNLSDEVVSLLSKDVSTSVLRNLSRSDSFKEPLIKSHMAALGLFRDGMQDVRGSEWSIPFATSTTEQTARKSRAHAGCAKIARSRCCAPRHRSLGYDLRRAPCDHRDFVSNAAHGGLNQRFLKAIATDALLEAYLKLDDREIGDNIASRLESYEQIDINKIAELLMKSIDPAIRRSLASNYSAPKKFIKNLLKDTDATVSNAAKEALG